jgi:TonB family protein
MATVAAAATVAVGAVAVLAGVGVVRLVNNAEVDNEIKRRSTSLPLVVQPGTEASLDLFFPLTPLSARTQVVYVDRKGEHRLDIDTRQMLEALDTIEMAPKLLSRIEPKFPHEARAAGARQGSVTALLTLDQQGHVQRVDVVRSEPAVVFDREARQTLQLWTYSKGRQDGRTVEVTLEFNR